MNLDEQDKQWIQERLDQVVELMIHEMGTRFGEVNARLDRMDATITLHGRHIGAGARAIAGWNDWTLKADEDYRQVLIKLAELKLRIDRLEGPK